MTYINENKIFPLKKYILLALFVASLATISKAQDTYFSQFYAASAKLNPALTGAFNGKYRVAAIYRDQWRKLIEKQVSTYAVTTDLSFNLGRPRKPYADKAAVGITFVSDRMGEFDYAYNQIAVTGAYHKALDPNNTTYLSIGTEISANQKTINYASLSFSDQFNGETGYLLGTNEVLPENNVAYFDYAIGLNFTSTPNDKISIFMGGAIHHLFKPSISFYKFDDATEDNPYQNFVPRKYSAQFNVRLGLADKFHLMPRAIFEIQGGSMKLDAGLNYRILLSAFNGTALQFGTYLRTLRDNKSAFNLDAVIGMVGIEYGNVLLGFSYDASLATLSDPRRRSAFEVSIAYLGNYENELVLCPKF